MPTLLMIGVLILMSSLSMAADASQDARFAEDYSKDHPHAFKAEFPDRAAWETRADFLRHQALVAQGLWPMPQKSPLHAVIHGKIERDQYTIEKVYFASMPGHYVSGNLYRPKNRTGKLPAVLAPYGHWPEGRFIWRDDNGVNKDMASGAEVDPIAARAPLQANCAMLARMGCIVFHYDMVGYCDSTKLPHREGFLDAESLLRLQSFMGLQTWNSIRSLDFVLSLPEVDPQRIAVTGSSSGGTQTIALCAVDPRPGVSFPMVMISMNMQGGCVCENAPLYRVGTNNVELACLFAPKPEGAAAANDWTVDFETRGLPEMKRIWKLFDAEGNVAGKHINFGHNHNLHSRELQYAFLNKHLKLGLPEPVKEKPFEPVPSKELSVWDAAHPHPADAIDAAALRQQMTRASDEQLAGLSEEEYARAVRTALKAMVVDSMPSSDNVEMDGSFLSRKGAGERVPYTLSKPAEWNGTVVVSVGAVGVKKLLDSGSAVLSIEPFMSATFPAPPRPATKPTRRPPNPPYAAYELGYERSIIAHRVHDLLTALAAARKIEQVRSVQLIGGSDQGVVALLASAIAPESIDRAAIALNGFSFSKITSDSDPMLLPGALKYGDVRGIARLCSPATRITFDPVDPGKLAGWLMEAR